MTRYFLNSPALYNGRAAAAYLLDTKPKRYSGYIGPDGTVRLMVEIESRELRDAAERIRP